MRVSRNELTSLLSRVFEGQGFIDFDAAAKQVVWLEQCGLQGLMRLSRCIDFLEQSAQPQAQLTDLAVGQMSLDIGGNSALACGNAATELLRSEAQLTACATLNVEHCRNRMFILQPLSECASRGINCLAHWHMSGGIDGEIFAMFTAGEPYPNIQTWESSSGLAEHRDHCLLLMCSEDAAPLRDYEEKLRSREASKPRQTESACLLAQQESSLDDGIEVSSDFWETLSRLGERVLVASSEDSRSRGAGPSGD